MHNERGNSAKSPFWPSLHAVYTAHFSSRGTGQHRYRTVCWDLQIYSCQRWFKPTWPLNPGLKIKTNTCKKQSYGLVQNEESLLCIHGTGHPYPSGQAALRRASLSSLLGSVYLSTFYFSVFLWGRGWDLITILYWSLMLSFYSRVSE